MGASARIVKLARPEEAPRVASEELARLLNEAVRAREWAFLALPGGASVTPVLRELLQRPIRWPQVEFYFVEERCVPMEHPASSYGVAANLLLRDPRIEDYQFHRMEAERKDRELAAERYAEEIPESFDAMLLQPGIDGHVGALFAHSPAFDPSEQRRVLPLDVAQKPVKRIALSPRTLEECQGLVVMATGRERAEMVRRALHGNEAPSELPARLLSHGTWIVDAAAASLL